MREIKLFLLIAFLLPSVSFGFGRSHPTPPAPTPPPSTLETGSFVVSQYEYKLPASQDDSILPGVVTEIWGRMYLPVYRPGRPDRTSITPPVLALGRPVIVLLHGNHETCSDMALNTPTTSCDYTFTGSCPAGQSVVQNHMGYDYLAQKLATFGYAVVSINANRGITCGAPQAGDNGLNLARGRLILRHLAYLKQWNQGLNRPASISRSIQNAFDFTQVGLFGHSRGGEGVRAAYNLLNDPGSPWPSIIGTKVNVRAIFEIGPVDGQTSRTLDAVGTAWNVLLPMCDGDVSDFEGMKPFDRMMTASSESPAQPKSMFAVWGANHNFYNTIWNNSDSPGCVGFQNQLWAANGGSPGERETALQSVLPFFRGHLGSNVDASLANVFNPSTSIPDTIKNVTRVDRAFIVTPNSSQFTLLNSTSSEAQGVTYSTVQPKEHATSATQITWNSGGNSVYFQDYWTAAGVGYNPSSVGTLSFRVSRTESSLNSDTNTNFQVQLVYSNGSLSRAVNLADYSQVSGPVGIPGNVHEILQTVRIPGSAFSLIPWYRVRGIRLTFNKTNTGEIFYTHAAFDHFGNIPGPSSPGFPSGGFTGGGSPVFPRLFGGRLMNMSTSISNDQIVRVGSRGSNAISGRTANDTIEVEVLSASRFPVRNALPVLTFNGRALGLGRISETGDQHRMIFTMKVSDIQALPASFELGVAHVEDMGNPIRNYGTYSRSSLFSGF